MMARDGKAKSCSRDNITMVRWQICGVLMLTTMEKGNFGYPKNVDSSMVVVPFRCLSSFSVPMLPTHLSLLIQSISMMIKSSQGVRGPTSVHEHSGDRILVKPESSSTPIAKITITFIPFSLIEEIMRSFQQMQYPLLNLRSFSLALCIQITYSTTNLTDPILLIITFLSKLVVVFVSIIPMVSGWCALDLGLVA
ncbi:hypothetical protein VNO77_02031 [Canavalia gladiata]|uniref:Uncharacterized protein n=1 Tax=Canavalia gladiata TaxID=3824 RepID=A0AAN9MSG9_CANGL